MRQAQDRRAATGPSAQRLRELCLEAWRDGARTARAGRSLAAFPYRSPTTAAGRVIGLSWLRGWQHSARTGRPPGPGTDPAGVDP